MKNGTINSHWTNLGRVTKTVRENTELKHKGQPQGACSRPGQQAEWLLSLPERDNEKQGDL